MNRLTVDTAIIGAGSAGLSALRQVLKTTENFILIDPGPLGTTCARNGCMPSKALIQLAKHFYRRHDFRQPDSRDGENCTCDIPDVLRYVRDTRDTFTGGMIETTHKLAGNRLLKDRARFLAPDLLRAGEKQIKAGRIIIATGTRPYVPAEWLKYGDRILTSENIFEQADLPEKIAVIGMGSIGIELSQALSRLGLEVTGFSKSEFIGNITDPCVNRSMIKILGKEFLLHPGCAAEIHDAGKGLMVEAGGNRVIVDKVLAAVGTEPNIRDLGLHALGVELDDSGIPMFDPGTMQVKGLPVYLAGDVNNGRPILHEAVDEGYISGKNAEGSNSGSFCRRVPLRIVFSDPGIAIAGLSYDDCADKDFIVGEADFSQQARAMLEKRNAGLLRIYADKASSRILGAEMAVPDAEHLAHLLALAISQKMTVDDMLGIPFYHPTTEEGLRSALNDAAGRLDSRNSSGGLRLCGSCPESGIC